MTRQPISSEERYRRLDLLMADLVEAAAVSITPQVDDILWQINWELREALGLPNVVH